MPLRLLRIMMPLASPVLVLLVFALTFGTPYTGDAQSTGSSDRGASPVLLDDFESDPVGEVPQKWIYVTKDEEIWKPQRVIEENERFFVAEEEGNRFVRLITNNEAQRFTLRNGHEFSWNVEDHPRIEWRWRANQLPEGASEKDKNDAGAAFYVTFGTDWLGRPKSIKYTYSSSLPVGTVVEYGPLYVIVVDSANEPGLGNWKTVQRNVRQDYRQVFGGSPPDRPISITIWSDSDTTGGRADVDFDDIRLLPPLQR